MGLVKTVIRKAYKGVLFLLFLSILLLVTVMLLVFLANPQGVYDLIRQTFGMG